MALYYLQLAKVLNPSGASARLAEAPMNKVATTWKDTKSLSVLSARFLVVPHRKDLILYRNM